MSAPLGARGVAARTLAVLAVAAAGALLVRFGATLIALFVAILVSVAVRPLVARLERALGGRLLAAAIVHVLVVGAIVAVAFTALPVVLEQVRALLDDLPGHYRGLREALLGADADTLRRIGRALPRALDLRAATPTADAVPAALATLRSALWLALTGTAVLVMSFYATLDGELVVRSLIALIPLERRGAARGFLDEAGARLAGFIRGQLIVCAAVGALALVAYELIGLPNALALAVLAGVLEAVPVIGPVLGAIPAGIVALAIDPTLALWVAASTVVIQVAENAFLVPRVMDKAVGVNPIVTILAVTGFGSVLGVVGGLLAIPLAALIQLVLDRTVMPRDEAPPTPAGRDPASALRYEAQDLALDIRKTVRNKGARASAAADRIEDDLEIVVAELDRLLQGEATP
jgi:predicted PurR-regulated permease PerM